MTSGFAKYPFKKDRFHEQVHITTVTRRYHDTLQGSAFNFSNAGYCLKAVLFAIISGYEITLIRLSLGES